MIKKVLKPAMLTLMLWTNHQIIRGYQFLVSLIYAVPLVKTKYIFDNILSNWKILPQSFRCNALFFTCLGWVASSVQKLEQVLYFTFENELF